MKIPEFPADEDARVNTLNKLDILYTPAEERFDRVTRIATRLFKVPIALVSLVTEEKQWFKSRQGLSAVETSREISFCGHAILNDDVFVIPNALKDPDFRDNPLVTGPPEIRFYAGQPIQFNGHRIGTLCLIDTKPKMLRPHEYDSLKSLGKWIELEIKDWSNAKDSFIRSALKLEHRETLLDPATGSLNEKGIELLQKRFIAHPSQEKFVVKLMHLENIEDLAKSDAVRIRIADCLRTNLGELGIIAFFKPNYFLVLLADSSPQPVAVTIANVKRVLTELVESGEIPPPVKIGISND